MRAIIVGSGPVGLWVGAILLKGGLEVVFVARPATADALRANGLVIRGPNGVETRKGFGVAKGVASLRGQSTDLICVCVKAYDLPAALDEIDAAGLMTDSPGALMVCFQNGVGSEEAMAARYGMHRVLAATTTTPLSLASDIALQVEKAGGGLAWAALDPVFVPACEMLAALAQRGCGRVVSDARSLKWSKLLLNLVGNATGAILDLPPAALYRDSRVFRLELALLREAIATMDAVGVKCVNLPGGPAKWLAVLVRALPDGILELILRGRFAAGRGAKRPSFHAELARGRGRSEAAWLNGAVADVGRAYGVSAPVNACLAGLMTSLTSGEARWDEFRGKPEALFKALREFSPSTVSAFRPIRFE